MSDSRVNVPHVQYSKNISSLRPPRSSNTANLTYEIPDGVADDRFTIDPVRGIVSTRSPFDRETKDFYTVPVYVTDASTTKSPAAMVAGSGGRTGRRSGDDNGDTGSSVGKHTDMFDVATIVVRITDVNDHAPEFRPGSCYPIAVPENGDTAVVHTVVATDLDEGANGEIAYSITGKSLEFSGYF